MFGQTFGTDGIAVSGSPTQPAVSGALYWDNNLNCVKVIDQYGIPQNVYTYTQNVGLDSRAQEAVNWAWKKMEEERNIAALLNKHPGLKDIKEKFDVMLALVQQEV